MWRAWRIILPVVIVNAAVQASLLIPGVFPYLSLPFVVLSLLSFVFLATAFGVVAVAMLHATRGAVVAQSVWSQLRERWFALLVWSLILVVVTTLGFALYVVPGLFIIAVTPYVLLAVVDGRGKPLWVNFRTIGVRWGRWLITIIVLAVMCLIVWVLALLNAFFIGDAGGAFIAWIALGLVASWFVCAWALIYRSVNPAQGGI